MSDESKPWDEQDWAASGPRPEKPQGVRRLVFIIVAVVGTVLLVGMFLWQQNLQIARERAELQQQMALEDQLAAERFEAEMLKTPRDEPRLDPTEALLLMARDPEALNNAGLFLLNQMDEPDEAIVKLREAARLDPKYVANLELALRRKAQKDRTAPFPREVIQP
ncbi:MAG: hypothetical protein C0467_08385 [Planctomycetaceae bacterium]|nr:hypothetical protein [Planctomycetaceae bacterium]